MKLDRQVESPEGKVNSGFEQRHESQAELSPGPSTSRLSNARSAYVQLRSLSSMSTQSEVGERTREARSECVTRRTITSSAREGVEEERERLDTEGGFCHEAME